MSLQDIFPFHKEKLILGAKSNCFDIQTGWQRQKYQSTKTV